MTLGGPVLTATHVIISLIGILSGAVVLLGMIAAKRMNGLTALFLVTTVLTSVTGFVFFPYHKVTPGIIVGILSLIALAIAIYARYPAGMVGGWRSTYVIAASISLYFNVFVLIVQTFEKVPALHALAPTGSEGPFKIAQLVCLILFVLLTILAAKKFHPEQATA